MGKRRGQLDDLQLNSSLGIPYRIFNFQTNIFGVVGLFKNLEGHWLNR